MAAPAVTDYLNPVTLIGAQAAGTLTPVLVDANGALTSVLAAGTAYIGLVAGQMQYVEVTPVLDTLIYAAQDVLFDSTIVTSAARAANEFAILDTITVIDGDDQAAAVMDLYFLSANVTLGTVNAAISISDANAANILGVVRIAAADWFDTINSKVASIKNVGMIIKPVDGTGHIYVAGVTGGTPTQTASGIKLRFGFRSI